MTGYVIACTCPRTGENIYLADRREHKGHWTYYLESAFVYKSKRLAEQRLQGLRHNNPRVIVVHKGVTVLGGDIEDIEHIYEDADPSWDTHEED